MNATAKVLQFPAREQQVQPKTPARELTLDQIRNFPVPATGKKWLRCDVLTGFGAVITANGARSYFVQARVKGTDLQPRVRLGSIDQIKMPAARSMARDLIALAHQGIDISRKATAKSTNQARTLTVMGAYQKYLAERDLKPATHENYAKSIKRMQAWHERELWSITKTEVSDMFMHLLKNHGKAHVRQDMSLFGSLWKHCAAELDTALQCPTIVLAAKQMWKKAKVGRKSRLITEADFPAWWASLDGVGGGHGNGGTWELYFKALALTGCRRSEMLCAEWTDYDAKNQLMTFPGERTKNKRTHQIPVGPVLASMLEAHRATQPPGTRFIFTHAAGPRRLTRPMNVVNRHVKAHGLKWSCHDLRRTYITVADSLNVPRNHLKALVNHIGGDVTDGYIRPENLRPSQEAIEAAIVKRARYSARR